MADKQPNQEEVLAHKLIKVLDDLLSTKDWDVTLFLKANKKRLEAIRSRTQSLLDQISPSEDSIQPKERKAPPGYKIVYISLFQVESNNLMKWQATIKRLVQYSVSRSIYSVEEHMRTLIRNKPDPQREAYVIAFVKENDIVKPYLGKKTQDQFGHDLVTLREQAIDLRYVIEFVHDNKRYHYSPEYGLVLI